MQRDPRGGATNRRLGQPKILDFGVARMTDAHAEEPTGAARTEAGQLVGTLAYMSPEQVAPRAGADAVDTRSDVYSLGVLAYEALTGTLPSAVAGKPLLDAARAICETPPVRPGAINRALRGDPETVLLKALEKDPARRYQSASAFGDDLRRALLDQPILARPPSTAYQLRKLVLRHRAASASLAALFVLVAGFGIWMSALYSRAERLRTAAQNAWTAELRAHEKATDAERLATRRAETAGKMLGVLVDAFRAVDPSLNSSADVNARDVVAREIVERGIRKIERELGDEPRIRAHLLASLGSTLGGLGYYDRGVSLLQEAIGARRAEETPAPVQVAEYLETMGRFLSQMGRDADARAAMGEAIAIYRANLAPHAPEIASALSSMAYLAVIGGDLAEAERLCLEAMRIHEKTPGHAGVVGAEPLNSLAGALSERGEYARSADVLRRALAQVEERGLDPIRMQASLRMNLAWVLCMDARYEEAEEHARWALQSRLKQYPAGHFRTSPPLLTLGLILSRTGRAEEGEDLIRQCIAVRRKAVPDNFGAIGEAESALGECLTAQGKLDEAESVLLASLRALQADSDPLLESAQLGLQRVVRLYEKLGDADKAGQYAALLRPPWDRPWTPPRAAPDAVLQ
jgi:tetratricopeptide (TPR) repeat protein